jgi:hypothetical protein
VLFLCRKTALFIEILSGGDSDSKMEKRTCSKCGSEYTIGSHHIPVRDTDIEDCSICGEVLVSWRKSTTIYSSKLVLKKENHLKVSE